MRLIRFLMERSPRLLVVAVLAGLLGGAASTALLVVINAGLDRSRSAPVSLIWVFVGLAGLAMITRATSALVLTSIGQSAMLQLRMRLSRQVLGVPLRRLEEVGIPRLLAIMTDDVVNILNAIYNVPLVCINAAALASCLVFLAFLSWKLFLIVLGLMVALLFTSQLPLMAAAKHFTLSRQEHNVVMAHLRGLISGVKELKVNQARRQAFVGELEGSAERFRAHTMAAMRVAVLGVTWGEMLSFLTIGLLVFVAPSVISVPESTLMNFVLVMLYIMEPLEFIQNQAPQFAKGMVALKSIEDVGLSMADAAEPVRALAPRTAWSSLELRDVSFAYHRDDGNRAFALGPLSLSFRPGELVFITGGNGSGKTTLGKLLVGLYSPDQGEVRLDGQTVGEHERDAYRQLFSTVFADFFLFDKLLGADPQGLDARARGFLQRLQLDQKVQVQDGALSTVDLSQGQRKRLALLAAYLEDRPVFLFDEWAADQDPAFKALFYQELLPELRARGRTVFVISHDDRYYDVADRVLKLDDGRLVSDVVRRAPSAPARESAPEPVAALARE